MIGQVIAYSALICLVSFGLVLACACAYFGYDERKRRAFFENEEAWQRVVYVARERRHNVCTFESTLPTVNARKGK